MIGPVSSIYISGARTSVIGPMKKVKPRSPIAMKVVNSEVQLAISQSSRGLDLVACLEGQKINNTFLKLFVQPETQQLYNKASFDIYLARSL
jgi:hypothetical protein